MQSCTVSGSIVPAKCRYLTLFLCLISGSTALAPLDSYVNFSGSSPFTSRLLFFALPNFLQPIADYVPIILGFLALNGALIAATAAIAFAAANPDFVGISICSSACRGTQ